MQSDQIDQIAAALAAAQGMMKNAAFDRSSEAYRNFKYASLAAIFDAVREAAIGWDGSDPIRRDWPRG